MQKIQTPEYIPLKKLQQHRYERGSLFHFHLERCFDCSIYWDILPPIETKFTKIINKFTFKDFEPASLKPESSYVNFYFSLPATHV